MTLKGKAIAHHSFPSCSSSSMNSNINPSPLSIANGTPYRKIGTLDQVIDLLPPGYKFLPTDVELIKYYLQAKIADHPIIHGRIFDVDVYEHSPKDPNAMYKCEGEQHIYFFTQRKRKYSNGKRPDRAVRDSGFWKASGKDHPIKSDDTTIGYKKSLVFHRGKPKGAVKTNWLMQEFTINEMNLASSSTSPPSKLDNWVLCKIYESKRGEASQDAIKVKECENKNQEAEQMRTLHNLFGEEDFDEDDMNPNIDSEILDLMNELFPNEFPPNEPEDDMNPSVDSEILDFMNELFSNEFPPNESEDDMNPNVDSEILDFMNELFPNEFPPNEPLP